MSESRVETFLEAAMTEEKETNLPKPRSRVEKLLNRMAENGVGGGSGSANIDVTAEVGQTIVVEEVDASGKPTKWKAAEYQPRTHWSEEIEIVPPTNFTPQYDSSISVPNAPLNDFELTSGEKYKVVFDGVEYTCEAFIGVLGTWNFTAVGNKIMISGEDTGEPFAVYKVKGATIGGVITLDMNPHTVRVECEIVHKIPEKYISSEREILYIFGNKSNNGDITIQSDAESILSLCEYDGNITPVLRLRPDSGSYPNKYEDFYLTDCYYGTRAFSRIYKESSRVYIEEVDIYVDGSIRGYDRAEIATETFVTDAITTAITGAMEASY